MSDAPRNPQRPKLLRGDARLQGRHWEALRAAVRRSGFSRIDGERAIDGFEFAVSARVHFTADGIRALYFFAEELRGRGASPTSAKNGSVKAFAVALLALGPAFPSDTHRAEALEQVILTEGQTLGRLRMRLDVNGPELRIGLAVATEATPFALGAVLRLRFGGNVLLTSELGTRGAFYGAAGRLLADQDLTSLAVEFAPFGEIILEPDLAARTR